MEPSNLLKEKRLALGLSFEDMSSLMKIEGASACPSTLSRIERGISCPRPSRLKAYSAVLKMDVQVVIEIFKSL
jgi:transcriptional regulator with XRE-family HTH domain